MTDDETRARQELRDALRAEWEAARRVKVIMKRIGKSREFVRDLRAEFIRDAMSVTGQSEAEVTRWFDEALDRAWEEGRRATDQS